MKYTSLLSIATVLLISGCSTTTVTTPQEQKAQTLKEEQIKAANSLPSWVLNPQSNEGITAVGMAGYSRHGIKIMKPQAEMDARAKLAGQIQTFISRSQKQALLATQVGDTDDMESVFLQSTKEVVKQVPLSGAVIINQKMVENGDYYVQLVIKKRELMNELNERKDIYKKNLENANLTRKNIDDGMKVLDKMMDNLDKDIQ